MSFLIHALSLLKSSDFRECITEAELFHWMRPVLFLTVLIISSICLLMRPISLFAVLMRHVGLFSKLSLWSFK